MSDWKNWIVAAHPGAVHGEARNVGLEGVTKYGKLRTC
jgi:hypothetical protein